MPAASGRHDLKLLVSAGAAMAALTALSVWLSPPAAAYGRASTWSASPDGAKAAFLTLRHLGYDVERSFEPVGSLRVDPAKTLLIVASPARPASAQDARAMRRFLESGGFLLATGDAQAFLPSAPATRRATRDAPAEPRRYRAATPGPIAAATPSLEMTPEVMPSADSSPYVPVFADAEAPGVLAARFGRGRAVWWVSSQPLLNRTIADAGSLDLLLATLGAPGERRILWDEHYHGHARSAWSYIAATPLPLAAAQIALLGLVALVTYGRRRGPIVTAATVSRASALEFVEAMASLYQRAGAAGSAVEVARLRLRRLLVGLSHLPAGAGDRQVVQAAARAGFDPAALTSLLDDARRAGQSSPSPAAALSLVQRLQEASAAARRAAVGSARG